VFDAETVGGELALPVCAIVGHGSALDRRADSLMQHMVL
jgi:hypothetical protein